MKKILLILAIIVAVVVIFPTTALAYDVLLDTEDVIELRMARFDCVFKVGPNSTDEILLEEEIEEGDLLYVIGTVEVGAVESPLVYLKCNTDNGTRYLYEGFTRHLKEEEYPWYEPPVVESKKENKNSNTGNSGSYRITQFCSACNSPAGSDRTASGTAYMGGVAFNDAPIGTTIYVEGYGSYTVMDRSGARCVDIWMGWSDSCHCSGNSHATVTW